VEELAVLDGAAVREEQVGDFEGGGRDGGG